MSDEPDLRLKKELDVPRRSRESGGRSATEGRELSNDDRRNMFRQQMYNDVLPNLPEIPGYHLVWLTTANPRDPIHQRLRLGYELLTAEDVPGFDAITLKTGDYPGCIGVNEMLAAKLPMDLYLSYMEIAHHDRPAEQEQILNQSLDDLRESAARDGGRLLDATEKGEINGMDDLRRSAPAPRFN